MSTLVLTTCPKCGYAFANPELRNHVCRPHPDTLRLDWLERQVRHQSTWAKGTENTVWMIWHGEEDLRAKIDAEMAKAPAHD